MSRDLKRQFISQLVESSRLLRNYIDHRAKGRGTTRAQWIVLFRLREQEGLSQVDLAEVLELQPISLVRLLDRLVEHGLLERRHDPRDRRANRLFLTAAGRQLVDDLDSLRDSIAKMCCRTFPTHRSRPRPNAPRHQGADQGHRRARPYRRQVTDPGIGSRRPHRQQSVYLDSKSRSRPQVVTAAGLVHITAPISLDRSM